jgi:hypothetical protein
MLAKATEFLTSTVEQGSPVSRLLELDLVVEALEGAFRPLACSVSVSSTKQSVSFVIFDSHGAQILRAAPRPGLEMRDPYSLRQTIDQVRAHLRTEGFKIDPWQAPT